MKENITNKLRFTLNIIDSALDLDGDSTLFFTGKIGSSKT